jgi:hypothetical protein
MAMSRAEARVQDPLLESCLLVDGLVMKNSALRAG